MTSKPARDKLVCALMALAFSVAGAGQAAPAAASSGTGGAAFTPPPPPPKRATLRHGGAIAPRGAPRRVRHVIAAANRLVRKPYRYGGGHRLDIATIDSAYDCSGSVSYALYGGRFLRAPLASGDLMEWGRRGRGRWITVYANRGHAYVVVAGLRFDTAMHDRDAGGPHAGPRWSRHARKPTHYAPRHPRGY
jgi:hypothetical protein